jgi:hypothetical protein
MLKTAKQIVSLLISGIGESKSSSTSQPSPSSNPDYYVWEKGENISISKYFSTKEFSCHCHFPDCKKQRISKNLVAKLGDVRKEIGQPLVVTSAFRCQKYQAFLRASGVNTVVAKASQHELGNAADVVPLDGKMEGIEAICAKSFDSIGLAKNFLHLDTRKGFRRWKY